MRRLSSPALILLIVVFLPGCLSTGVFKSTNLTNVELSEANYRVVATNVAGEASAGYLFGVSGAIGAEMRAFGLIRVRGEGELYKAALENLWENFEDDYGPPEDRPLALVNVRYDSDALNVVGLYTAPSVSIRADVVEFEE